MRAIRSGALFSRYGWEAVFIPFSSGSATGIKHTYHHYPSDDAGDGAADGVVRLFGSEDTLHKKYDVKK